VTPAVWRQCSPAELRARHASAKKGELRHWGRACQWHDMAVWCRIQPRGKVPWI